MAKKKTQEAAPPKAAKNTPSTVKYLPFSEIRNDTVVMNDGSLRAILLVSSINFFLKSDDEQQAIINGYMALLNTFDFPVQIVVQSRKFDITKYLSRLEEIEKKQTNDLLRMQMGDYREFVTELVELGQIMDKKFFLVVPYDPAADRTRGFRNQFQALFSAAGTVRLKNEQFAKRKHFLDQRVANITSVLKGMGLNCVQLDTQGIIEVLYTMYNPETAQSQKLVETSELNVEE